MTRHIILAPDGTYVTVGTDMPPAAEMSAIKTMLGTRPAWLVRISHSLYHRTKPDAEIVHTFGAPVGFEGALEKAWKSARYAAKPGPARAAVDGVNLGSGT